MSLQLDGTSGVLGNSGAFIAGTAVASTSGTSFDYTSIPSWVKRITVMFNQVSTNGSSNILIQVGAGSVTTSGYVSGGGLIYGTNSTLSFSTTSGILVYNGGADNSQVGIVTLTLVSSNNWVASVVTNPISTWSYSGAGKIALGGTLDRVRITTVNGTDTFDAGSINILYE
jgi:hypothetical protein